MNVLIIYDVYEYWGGVKSKTPTSPNTNKFIGAQRVSLDLVPVPPALPEDCWSRNEALPRYMTEAGNPDPAGTSLDFSQGVLT